MCEFKRFIWTCAAFALQGCFFTPTGSGAASGSATAMTESTGSPTTDAPTTGAPTTDAPTTGPGGPSVRCTEEPFVLGPGIMGVTYEATVQVEGGAPPYTWSAGGLPPGLVLTVSDMDSAQAVITGAPEAVGDFPVEITALDANNTPIVADCGALSIVAPLALDTAALLAAFPRGCISHDVSVKNLEDLGILTGGDGSPPVCSLIPGRGNGSRNFDQNVDTPDTFPPGISVDADTCKLSGTVDPTLRYGIYAWITTVEQSGVSVHVPYCAPQAVQVGTAYGVARSDAGAEKTLDPGVVVLGESDVSFSYGTTEPDPQVAVTYNENCGGFCFFAYYFSYTALSGESSVSGKPSAKFPEPGFEGFTHAVRISEAELVDELRGRAFVASVSYDYCIAKNDDDCGNSEDDPALKVELIRENGGGSNYEFALIVLPE